MSQWDFGHGREPTEHHEPQYPQQPPYPYPEQQEPEYPYAQEPQHPQYAYPQEPQYQYPQPPQYPDAQYPDAQQRYAQQPPYPPHPYPQQPEGPGRAAYLPDPAGWSGDAGQADNAGWSENADWSDGAGRPDNAGWLGGSGWSGNPGQPDNSGWQGDAGWPGDVAQPEQAGWPDADGYRGDGEAYDPPDAYPITYERDEFEGRASGPVEAPTRSFWPPAPDPADRFGSDPSVQPPWRPAAREPWRPGGDAGPPFGPPPPPRSEPWSRGDPPRPQGDAPWPQDAEAEWDDEEAPDDRWRWLIPASLAVAGAAVGAAIVVFALGHAKAAAGTSSPAAAPSSATGAAPATGGAASTPLTLAAAKSVLAGYTSANNNANTRRSASTLAGVETAGSYAIDAGLYTVQAADGAAPYAAFTPVAATYYIPRAEPADGPRWFAVQVSNAFTTNPGKVTSTEYLLFTQAASGGAWQNAVEPYLLAGADAPQIAVGGDGLATAVSPTATSLAVAPGKLAERTGAAIDGTGTGVTVADPGALADRSDQTFWRGKLPTATVTDAHTAATGAAGQTFALLTTTGGALVFYTDAAEVAITPPAGSAIHLTVPGYYSPAQALSRAGLSYLDQFAAADPPAGAGTPQVVAEYSGITGKN
jgi:hypothetical protein